jgi:hypothetical protein
MVTLDVAKAFDRIWHDGLISKMMKLDFPTYITKITKSFLIERTFCVIVDGKRSTSRTIPFGVTQGAVLSPTLFNIYLHDIPLGSSYDTAQFADDTALSKTAKHLSAITTSLKWVTSRVDKFMTKWKITINADKTNALYITNRKKNEVPNGPLHVFGADIN